MQNFTPSVSRRAFPPGTFRFAHEILAQPAGRHSFPTVIPLNHFVHHEISQLHCNKPPSKHRAITVKSRQIQRGSFVETSLRLPNVLAAQASLKCRQNAINNPTFANKVAEVSTTFTSHQPQILELLKVAIII